jgi:hypothetical protein
MLKSFTPDQKKALTILAAGGLIAGITYGWRKAMKGKNHSKTSSHRHDADAGQTSRTFSRKDAEERVDAAEPTRMDAQGEEGRLPDTEIHTEPSARGSKVVDASGKEFDVHDTPGTPLDGSAIPRETEL